MFITTAVVLYSGKSVSEAAVDIQEILSTAHVAFGRFAFRLSALSYSTFTRPTLLNLGDIEYQFSPFRRSISFPSVSAVIRLGEQDRVLLDREFLRLAVLLVSVDNSNSGTPITRIFDGVVTDVTSSTNDLSVTISALAWEANMGNAFPSSLFSRADFPDAPSDIVGVYSRQVIIGEFNFPIAVRQIDRQGQVFYVCDPPLRSAPRAVMVGGSFLPPDQYRFIALRTARSGIEFTALVLSKPVSEFSSGLIPVVSVVGGVGMRHDDAISIIVQHQGLRVGSSLKYAISRLSSDFPMSVLLNKRDNGMEILLSRLFPQTVFVPMIRNGALEVIDPDPLSDPVLSLRRGYGLIGRTKFEQQGFREVVNSVQVNCGMTHYGGQALRRPLVQVVRGPTSGPRHITSIASKSASTYGYRFVEIDGGDLAVQFSPGGAPLRSVSGEMLAERIILLSSFEGYIYEYAVTWDLINYLELGDIVYLTDPDIGLFNKKFMVVRKVYSNDPSIAFQRVFVA
ncbi:MAG: hypothetical protein QXT45_02270 [Candidatus Bilamarchaeaceae archaeon]